MKQYIGNFKWNRNKFENLNKTPSYLIIEWNTIIFENLNETLSYLNICMKQNHI